MKRFGFLFKKKIKMIPFPGTTNTLENVVLKIPHGEGPEMFQKFKVTISTGSFQSPTIIDTYMQKCLR